MALGGQHVGVAGVGVTRAQVGLDFAGQDGVAGRVGVADHERAQGAEVGPIRLAQEA